MINDPIIVNFANSQNPMAAFDILRLQKVYSFTGLNHSQFEPHLVKFYMILLVESGNGIHTIDFENYKLKAGSLLTVRKDQIHQFHKSNVTGKLLLFTDDFLVSYLEKLEALKTLQLFNEILGVPKIQLNKQSFSEINSVINRINKEYFKTNDSYSLGIIRSELHILITKLYRLKAEKNTIHHNKKYLKNFIAFQNLVEENVFKYSKVKDYARLLGVSTKTLNTITQSIVNKSAKVFIDDICIKQIKRLLINTEQTVKEIAYLAGFDETTNFYKYFKRQTKLTPEQFRVTKP